MVDVPTTEGVYFREEDRELLERIQKRPESFSAFMRHGAAFLLAFFELIEEGGSAKIEGYEDWEVAAVEERMALLLYEEVREAAGVGPVFRVPREE